MLRCLFLCFWFSDKGKRNKTMWTQTLKVKCEWTWYVDMSVQICISTGHFIFLRPLATVIVDCFDVKYDKESLNHLAFWLSILLMYRNIREEVMWWCLKVTSISYKWRYQQTRECWTSYSLRYLNAENIQENFMKVWYSIFFLFYQIFDYNVSVSLLITVLKMIIISCSLHHC